MRLTVELHKALFGKDKIKTKKRAFSSATNEVRRSRKRVLIASAMRKQPKGVSLYYKLNNKCRYINIGINIDSSLIITIY